MHHAIGAGRRRSASLQLQSLLADPFAKSGNTLVLNTDKLSQSGVGFCRYQIRWFDQGLKPQDVHGKPENTAVKPLSEPGWRLIDPFSCRWQNQLCFVDNEDEKTFNEVTSAIDGFSAQSKKIVIDTGERITRHQRQRRSNWRECKALMSVADMASNFNRAYG